MQWAWALSEHRARYALYMADRYVFDNEFEERSQELLDYVKGYPEEWVPYWKIGRKFRSWSDREKEEIIRNLFNGRFIEEGPANPGQPGATGRRVTLAGHRGRA